MNDQTPISHDPFSLSTPQSSLANQQTASRTAISQGLASQQQMAPSGQANPNPAVAGNDVIEAEWLDRTQHVLRNFAADPYQLSKEFSALRAEYIKHRYGKVLKESTGEQDS